MDYNLGVITEWTGAAWVQVRRTYNFTRAVINSFAADECTLRAAALAYYGLFSMFPLLLFLIYLATNILTTTEAQLAVNTVLEQILPFSPDQLENIIGQILASRSSIGVISLAGLLWSGSAVFAVLEAALTVIWGGSPRAFWSRRLIAAFSVMLLSMLFVAYLYFGPILSWLLPAPTFLYSAILSQLFGFALLLIICTLLFRIFPNRNVRWTSAINGAIVTALFIQIARFFFDLYLGLAFRNFGLIYGSLAWIVALALWSYLVAVLFFFGAEVGAELEEREQLRVKKLEASV